MSKAIKVVDVNDKDHNAQLMSTLKSKSSVIRYLAAESWDRSRIAKSFEPELRYQHVRNVLVKEPKKNKIREMVEGDL